MGKISSWGRRLRSMPTHELVDRVRQQVVARADAWRYSRGHDFAQGVGSDPAEARGIFLFAPRQVPALCSLLGQRFPGIARDIVLRAERILRHRFDLLGYENLDYGAEIDWHLDIVHAKRAPRKPWYSVKYLDFEEVGDSKVTWELNRHQHLVTLAKAYRLTGDERFATELVAQWKHWHADNPYPIGLNWASSLEVAFRSLSWIWTYFLLADSPVMTPELRRDFVRAWAVSGRHIETFLSTYFSPNTHLLGEAVALFFMGTLFPELPRASRWKARGWKIVLESAEKQVRGDGFYFEQSTYYHVYALDMFLHARILAVLNGLPIPPDFDGTLVKMLDASCLLSRAGIPSMVGDDDGGRLFDGCRNLAEHLLDPLSTGAVLFGRGDFKCFAGSMREETLWLLGEHGLDQFESLKTTEPFRESVALRESGFYLMADAESGQQLTLDAGPHGPGHGHADALSVQLIRNGKVVLMDPGTYEYIGDSGARVRYRGTGAHNTVRVDRLDQVEGKGPFGWEQPLVVKVEQWVTGKHFSLFVGSHDGYTRLPEPVTHRRCVFHRRGQFWLVRDAAAGQGEHQLELSWHLGPALLPASTKDNLFADGQETLGLVTPEGHGWAQSGQKGSWSPVYGRQERSTLLTFGWAGTLPAEFVTMLLPDVNLQTGMGRLERMASAGSIRGYRYVREQQEHCFFFADEPRPWTLGNWASDAQFLYWSWDRVRDLRLLVICGGTFAEVGGFRVLTSERVVDYAEVTSSTNGTELRSSDPDRVVVKGSLDRVEMALAAPGPKQGTEA